MDNNQENPVLFEIRCPESYKQYFDFQIFSLIYRQSWLMVIILIVYIFIIIAALGSIAAGDLKSAARGFITLVLACGFIFLTVHSSSKKHMESPVVRQNVNQFLFYQDCFVNNDINSQSSVRYDMIMDAYETQKYFYLYIEQQRAYIIEKSGFVYNTPDEMRRLLQIKLGCRFHIKAKQ